MTGTVEIFFLQNNINSSYNRKKTVPVVSWLFERSTDPIIVELHQSLLFTDFQDAPVVVFDAVSAAKASVSNIIPFIYF